MSIFTIRKEGLQTKSFFIFQRSVVILSYKMSPLRCFAWGDKILYLKRIVFKNMLENFSSEQKKMAAITGAILAAVALAIAGSLYFFKAAPEERREREREEVAGELTEEEKIHHGIDPRVRATTSETEGGEGTIGKMKVIIIDDSGLPRDTDGDGLSDEEEASLGSSAASRDTDGDGIDDKDEVRLGTDPLEKDNPFKKY